MAGDTAHGRLRSRMWRIDTMEWIFIISAAFIIFTYGVYPLYITIRGTFFMKRAEKRYNPVPLTVVVTANNEEAAIGPRIENLIEQEYPQDLVEIIVVSHGSTDRTLEVARGYARERIKVINTVAPVGKAQAINLGVEAAKHDIIVFAEARQHFSTNTFAELAALFYDDAVGAVSGDLVSMRDEHEEVRDEISLYRSYEKLIQRKESSVDSVLGATGSIYAVRKGLFEPLPPRTLLDNFLTPMRIVLKGYRVLFIRSAKAIDRVSKKDSQEFKSYVRMFAGSLQAITLEKALLCPWKNRLFFQLMSLKIARLLVPYFCVAAFLSNTFLDGPFFQTTLMLQILFYGSALLHPTPLERIRAGALIRVTRTFVVLNAAAIVAFWVSISRIEQLAWEKSKESPGAP